MGATLQKVKAVQDESGHWYVIPDEMFEEFDRLLERSCFEDEGAEEAENEFCGKFDKYRTGGDLNNVQLFAEL